MPFLLFPRSKCFPSPGCFFRLSEGGLTGSSWHCPLHGQTPVDHVMATTQVFSQSSWLWPAGKITWSWPQMELWTSGCSPKQFSPLNLHFLGWSSPGPLKSHHPDDNSHLTHSRQLGVFWDTTFFHTPHPSPSKHQCLCILWPRSLSNLPTSPHAYPPPVSTLVLPGRPWLPLIPPLPS